MFLILYLGRDRNRLDRIEDRIGKLASDFNDIIRKKV